MQIEVEYGTQVRTVSGRSREQLDLADHCSLADALLRLLDIYPKLGAWIDASGQPRPGLLVFVNDQSPSDTLRLTLKPNDQLALMTLVSGG